MKRRILLGLAAFIAVIAGAAATQVRMDIPAEELAIKYAPPPSRFIAVDGLKIHYRDEGTGHPLVLIHGTASSLHTWDAWTSSLSGRFRVIRMDLPAFGLTGPGADRDYRVERYVLFLDRFLAALNVTTCSMAGNSLGGNIAWEYALAHPEKIRKLILIDSAGYPMKEESPLSVAKTPVLKDILRVVTPRFVIARGVKASYGDPGKVTERLVTRYYEMMLRDGNRRAMVDRMGLARVDRSAFIKSLSCPVLILWGGKDHYIPVDHAERFVKDIPGASLKIYPGAGHVPMEEIPGQSATDAMEFLL